MKLIFAPLFQVSRFFLILDFLLSTFEHFPELHCAIFSQLPLKIATLFVPNLLPFIRNIAKCFILKPVLFSTQSSLPYGVPFRLLLMNQIKQLLMKAFSFNQNTRTWNNKKKIIHDFQGFPRVPIHIYFVIHDHRF
jgi:hypothetical protein